MVSVLLIFTVFYVVCFVLFVFVLCLMPNVVCISRFSILEYPFRFPQGVRIPLMRGALDAILCDKVCRCFTAGRWFSQGTPVSAINKIDRVSITEIFWKVALKAINTHTFSPKVSPIMS